MTPFCRRLGFLYPRTLKKRENRDNCIFNSKEVHLRSFCTASAHTLLINAIGFKLMGLAILQGLRCTFDSYSLEILQISLWRRYFLELSLAFSYYCLACIVMLNKHDGCSMDVLGLFFKSKYRYPLLGEANQYGERKFAPDHLS